MASSRSTGTNENVSTIKASGGDYNSLVAWELATDYNLVTAQVSEVAEIYDSYDGTFEGSSEIVDVAVTNITWTNSSYFRIIRPAPGQSPQISAQVTLDERYAEIQDIYCERLDWTSGQRYMIRANGRYCRIVGCTAHAAFAPGQSGTTRGIVISMAGDYYGDDAPGSAYVYNCVAFDNDYGFTFTSFPNDITVPCYNCTAEGNYRNYLTEYHDALFAGSAIGRAELKNCIAANPTMNDYEDWGFADWSWAGSSTNNASSDDSAPGSNPQTGILNYRFVSDADNNYRLNSDSPIIDMGVDLSGVFDDDFDYVSRPQGSAWDIGAFEFAALAKATFDIAAKIPMVVLAVITIGAAITVTAQSVASTPAVGTRAQLSLSSSAGLMAPEIGRMYDFTYMDLTEDLGLGNAD